MSAASPLAGPVDDGADFVRKWRGAWPEWGIAEAFLPASERGIAPFWQALQFELQEAAWGGGDPRPGEVKLGWWMEELAGWGQGRRRHPLGARLLRQDAPWAALARALPSLAASRTPQPGIDAALRSLDEVAGAVGAIESALLAGRADAAAMVAACWSVGRLARHRAGMAAGADAAEGGGADAWADELRVQWPDARGLAAARRLEAAIALSRLRAGSAARPCGPLRTLWACWRAARD